MNVTAKVLSCSLPLVAMEELARAAHRSATHNSWGVAAAEVILAGTAGYLMKRNIGALLKEKDQRTLEYLRSRRHTLP